MPHLTQDLKMPEESKISAEIDEQMVGTTPRLPKKRFWRRLLRGLLLALLLCAVTGFVWDQIATQVFLAKYPPVGEIVRVDNVDFHVLVRGKRSPGQPAVVIDAGVGDGVAEWLSFIEECESFAQLIVTDRRGHGYSSGVFTGSRTPSQNVEDLKKILDAKAIEPPYVLVGASMGGINARLFQALYPDSVLGLMLVDALAQDHLTPAEVKPVPLYAYPFAFSGRLGMQRLLGLTGPDTHLFPIEYAERIRGTRLRGTYFPSLLNHVVGLVDGFEETNSLLKPERAIPLTVISADGPGMGPPSEWREVQDFLQGLSPTATCIDLKCNHSVHLAKEELVVNELRSMLDTLRSGADAGLKAN